jgi:two-component system, LuxR family, sensor kinase FixL
MTAADKSSTAQHDHRSQEPGEILTVFSPAPKAGDARTEETQPRPKEAETEKRKYQGLLSCVGDLVFHVQRGGTIQDFYCPRDHELALSAEGVVGKRIVELLPTQIGLQAMHYVEKALRTGSAQRFSYLYNLPGRVREFQARLAPSGPDEVVALIRDITDRRVFEKEILDVSHRTQLRIGQDLHDGLGQHLTGITFLSKALENKLSAKGLIEAEDAAEIARLVIQALAQTRSLARGLFPVELESGGLLPALKELAGTLKGLFQLSCGVECEPNLVIHDRSVANHLFRLAQEAVTNAVKHAHAQRVTIRLFRRGDKTVLSITDDGTGFDVDQKVMSGLGMRIMQYRAKKIGANLEIHAAATGGTEVVCSFLNASGEEEVLGRQPAS